MTKSKSEIEVAATQLLRKHKLFKPPVPVDELAGALGISIHYEVLGSDVSALLVIKSGKSHIAVNSAHHVNRQRFSIAHEIGHFHLHHGADDASDRLFVDTKFAFYQPSQRVDGLTVYARSESSSNPEEERQANEFAAALLMPKELIVKYVQENQLDLTDEFALAQLAQAFRVSEQAMTIRAQYLGLMRGALYS